MQVIIMAGGKGTRISSVNSEVPKPLLEIAGKPILVWQILALKKQGINEFVICVGHLGEKIKNYLKDGSELGVSIRYITEKEPLGTAGALYYLKDDIKEDFLLLNGDIIFDFDLQRFYTLHKKNNCIATIFTHPNSHPYDSGIIESDVSGKVTKWLHKEDPRTWYKNRVNAGIHMLSPEIFTFFEELRKVDLDRDILKPLISKGELYVYDSPEYVKDMGTPDRYYSVEKDILSGRVNAKNLNNRQRAVFLDRDGTLNQYVGFLRDIKDFKLLPYSVDLVKRINNSGFLAIVVTNQPVIARGEVTWEQLNEIHNKMETLLGEEGAYVDDIFVCPHHPDKGFTGEIPEYKVECECRKPKPGLIFAAAEKYNIDLRNSYMIGDSESDIQAGKAAGCKCIKIERNEESFESWIDDLKLQF